MSRATPGHEAQSRPVLDTEELLSLVRKRLDDDQAEDVVVVDLHGKSTMCDYMVIASGRSQRQVAAMADHLAQLVKANRARAPAVEGLPHADWVLIDGGDVIVHLFRPEVRRFYNLEKMWGIELPESGETLEPRPAIALARPGNA